MKVHTAKLLRAFKKLEAGDTIGFESWVTDETVYEAPGQRKKGTATVLKALQECKTLKVERTRIRIMTPTECSKKRKADVGFVVELHLKGMHVPMLYDMWFDRHNRLLAIEVVSA